MQFAYVINKNIDACERELQTFTSINSHTQTHTHFKMSQTRTTSVVINVDKVQEQVRREILADAKYQRENSAKLRAVEQRVPTYEDFRQIVLASHLKPLDKGESLLNNVKPHNMVWNSVSNRKTNVAPASASNDYRDSTLVKGPMKLPRDGLEFIKMWSSVKSDDNEAKWHVIEQLGKPALFQLLKPDINGDILGQFITLFEWKLQQESANDDVYSLIFDLLSCFVECKRFQLNKMFLTSSQVQCFKVILTRLQETDRFAQEDLTKLENIYLK